MIVLLHLELEFEVVKQLVVAVVHVVDPTLVRADVELLSWLVSALVQPDNLHG